jgi:hypothetical protein
MAENAASHIGIQEPKIFCLRQLLFELVAGGGRRATGTRCAGRNSTLIGVAARAAACAGGWKKYADKLVSSVFYPLVAAGVLQD